MKLFKKKLTGINIETDGFKDFWKLGISRKKLLKYIIIAVITLIFGLLAAFDIITLDFVRELLRMFIDSANEVK